MDTLPATPTIPKRNLALYIILAFVTCGLFGLYWFCTLNDDTNKVSGHPEEMSGIVALILTIVTCGIYGYWYIYQMAQDATVLCAEDGEETPGLAIYILLSIVTCGIYSYYWQYKLANRLQNNGYRYGVQVQEGGSDVLIWLILGALLCIICSYVGTNIIFKNMNELCAAYNRLHGYEG